MFYACFTLIGSWEGKKNFRVWIFLNINLSGYGYKTLYISRISTKDDIQVSLVSCP